MTTNTPEPAMSAADTLTKLIELQTGGGDIEEIELERYLRNNAEAIRDLIVAAEKAGEAMNVWVNTYAPEFCEKSHVEESRKIINEAGGTLAYIADVNEQIHEALAKIKEQP